jgi:hypothetical protein
MYCTYVSEGVTQATIARQRHRENEESGLCHLMYFYVDYASHNSTRNFYIFHLAQKYNIRNAYSTVHLFVRILTTEE